MFKIFKHSYHCPLTQICKLWIIKQRNFGWHACHCIRMSPLFVFIATWYLRFINKMVIFKMNLYIFFISTRSWFNTILLYNKRDLVFFRVILVFLCTANTDYRYIRFLNKLDKLSKTCDKTEKCTEIQFLSFSIKSILFFFFIVIKEEKLKRLYIVVNSLYYNFLDKKQFLKHCDTR